MPIGSVAVIGGGPAGLIAAEHLAAAGVTVTVFEARRSVGRKFLLAGRSGLNLTNDEPQLALVERYLPYSTQLRSALDAYTPSDLRSWSEGLGQSTFVGSSGRVFPEAMRATPLLRAWLARLQSLGVRFEVGHEWAGWEADGSLRFKTADGDRVVQSDASIFCLGGASWPGVGSDGSWASIFTEAGITVRPLTASNCGVAVEWSQPLVDQFEGTPVKNVSCSCADSDPVRGDIVVTATGLEGGPIYGLGPVLRSAIAAGDCRLLLDTAPDLTASKLTQRLSKRRPKASATSWLRSAGVAPIVVALAREATANQLPSSPQEMAALLKSLPIDVSSMAPIDRAISTAGGIASEELNDEFMLRKRPGTFIAGEMLDWDAPTGGYLLQACFSTGVAAARGVLAL